MENLELSVLETDPAAALIKQYFDRQGVQANHIDGVKNYKDDWYNRFKKFIYSGGPRAILHKETIAGMLSELFGQDKKRRLVLYGNGAYHHYTYGLCRLADKLSEEYGYIHVDHHADLILKGYSRSDKNIHCGVFVHAIMQETNAEKALFIGTKKTLDGYDLPYPSIAEHNFMNPGGWQLLKEKLQLLPNDVYLTLDLDVMHAEEISTDYDRGTMRRTQLLQMIDIIKNSKNIISADVLGLATGGPYNTTELGVRLYGDITTALRA